MTATARTADREHTVAAPILRAQIAQGEFAAHSRHEDWLPYIDEAFATLPQRVQTLIDTGHPRSAEYWLRCAERFACVIDQACFTRAVAALGTFELVGE